jgi:hypothetical protein
MTFSQRLENFEKEHDYTAYIYAVISNISIVLLQMNIKIVSNYISPLHALALRGFFLLLINTIIIHFSNISWNVKDKDSKDFLNMPSFHNYDQKNILECFNCFHVSCSLEIYTRRHSQCSF